MACQISEVDEGANIPYPATAKPTAASSNPIKHVKSDCEDPGLVVTPRLLRIPSFENHLPPVCAYS